MIRFAWLPSLVLSVVVSLSGVSARADQGSVWTLSQDGRLLNKVATWERENGRARIMILGSTQFLDVNMRDPLATSGGVQIFIYTAIDTKAQWNNPQIWRAIARGEIALDNRTARGNSLDGWWRKTESIRESAISSELIREDSPRQFIRFVVE